MARESEVGLTFERKSMAIESSGVSQALIKVSNSLWNACFKKNLLHPTLKDDVQCIACVVFEV